MKKLLKNKKALMLIGALVIAGGIAIAVNRKKSNSYRFTLTLNGIQGRADGNHMISFIGERPSTNDVKIGDKVVIEGDVPFEGQYTIKQLSRSDDKVVTLALPIDYPNVTRSFDKTYAGKATINII